MAYTRTFEGYIPPRRYDGLPFTQALIRESATETGTYATIDTKTLSPADADPTEPATRNFTTALATLETGWYIIRWQDGDGAIFDSDPVFYPSEGTAADSFITVAELGDKLGEDLTTDDHAARAVDAACAVCRTISEQSFTLATSDVVLDGTGTEVQLLPQHPVNTVGTVTEDGTVIPATDYTLDAATGALIRVPSNGYLSSNITLRPSVVWNRGRQNIAVNYTHGYASDDFPEDVRIVALNIAARLYKQGSALFESLGAYQVRYGIEGSDLTANEERVLRRHKRER